MSLRFTPEIMAGKKGDTRDKIAELATIWVFFEMWRDHGLNIGFKELNKHKLKVHESLIPYLKDAMDKCEEELNNYRKNHDEFVEAYIFESRERLIKAESDPNSNAMLNGFTKLYKYKALSYLSYHFGGAYTLYKPGETFAKAISNLNKGVPFDRISLCKPYYFIYPKFLSEIVERFYKDKFGSGKLQALGGYCAFEKIDEREDAYVLYVVHDLSFNNVVAGGVSLWTLVMDSEGNMKISDDFLYTPKEKSEPRQAVDVLPNIVVNSLIYLQSEDAEIDSLKPISRRLANGKTKNKGYVNPDRLTLPVKRIHWRMKEPVFTCGQVKVNTHLRWQPCGPQRSKVKLIWVKAHTRNYNKPKETKCEETDKKSQTKQQRTLIKTS